jgi:hypothetical protein
MNKLLYQPIGILIIVCCCAASKVAAQDSLTEKKYEPHFKAQLKYLTNSVYNGRKDSAATPYVTPSLTYSTKFGLSLGASLSYLANSDSRIDLVNLNAGYDFKISKRVSASVYASKYFYNQSSTAVNSEMTGDAGGDINYDAGFLNFGGSIYLGFSATTDIGTNLSVAHGFYIGDEGNQWSISPTVTVDMGTQNFYGAYKKSARVQKKKGSSGTVMVEGSSNFTLLAYELSLPITYDGKKWGLFFTPTYALPKNAVSLTRPNGNVFAKEKLSNSFYAEMGVYVKF